MIDTDRAGDEPTINREDAIKNLRNGMKIHGNQAGWEQAWQNNTTPWEAAIGNIPQPALVSTMETDENTRHLLPSKGKVVVPGCGRGQDVEYFAKLGFTATGIDISQRAVERAREVSFFDNVAAHYILMLVYSG